MSVINKFIASFFALFFIVSITACSPEVGSEAWCTAMKEKPKGEWTTNDAKAFASDCFFK